MSHAYRKESVVSQEGANNRDVAAFLAHLPGDTPVYRYGKKRALYSLFPDSPSLADSIVVLKNLSPKAFDEIGDQIRGPSEYSASLQILIATMASQPHEEAASSFERLFHDQAVKMIVYRKIANCGATRVKGIDWQKQADRSWKPARQGREFPTVALEVGYSQTAAMLQRITWWIHNSGGQVKMGITIDIKRDSANIEITSWVPASEPLPKHVYITAGKRKVVDKRTHLQPEPRMLQKILIRRAQDGKNHTIKGGELTIPFESVLLTPPGAGEHDFVFTHDMLVHDLAERIWDAVDDYKEIKAK